MTSVLSRIRGGGPARRGAARSVPAERRRTPNPVTDSMSLQAVVAADEAPPAGRRGRGPGPGPGQEDEPASGRTGGRRRPAGTRSGRRHTRDDSAGHDRPGKDDRLARAAAVERLLEDPNEADASRRDGSARDEPGAGRRAGGRRFQTDGLDDGLEAEPSGGRPADDGTGPAQDRLAWFRQGWLGPLAIAVVVSLVAVGLYVLLAGRGEDGGTQETPPATVVPTAPRTTNPDALVGKALVDGRYECVELAAAPTASPSAAPAAGGAAAAPGPIARELDDVLIVLPVSGQYTWNGEPGEYTINTPTFENENTVVVASVTFTSGPLKDQRADSVTYGQPDGGPAPGTLKFTQGSNMFCAVN
ncbi:MAG: hypothetical protein IRZ08_20370 [Frankia sp.]|nr:hypothetical protein [Frankia sp.]